MNHVYHQIGAAAARLAERLPNSVMIVVAEAVGRYWTLEPTSRRQAILQSLPTPDFRDSTSDFLDDWLLHAPGVGQSAVVVALLTAARSEQNHRGDESVEVVWTGPEPSHTLFRHTEQALLEVINGASRHLTVVSYAVYRIPHVREALVRAARRRVQISVIVETPDKLEGANVYSTLRALGEDVAACSTVYYWPKSNRAQDENGKVGILHVKCAVADGRWLFLSSANLTEYAFTINMELGLLVNGGKLPGQVEIHFERLIKIGQLLKV